MNDTNKISGRQIAAARALIGVGRAELAEAMGIPAAKMGRIEAGGAAPLDADIAERARRAFENFGAIFIPEGDGFGAGVRLKFMRLDARQIGRLEDEGGAVGEDDVP